MAAFEAELLDVGAERFGDSQPVDGQQGDERVLGRRRQSGGDEQRTDVVAVQTGGVGLVVKARAPNMSRWRPLQHAFLFGVAVEARHRAQAACDRRSGTPSSLEVPTEALDVSPAHGEQAQMMLLAPGDELAQIQGVGLAGQAAVAGKERRQRVPLGVGERRVDDRNTSRRSCGGHVAPPGQAETQRPERQGPSNMLTASTYARSVAADHRDRPSSRTRPTADSGTR
jgi:hypothetical protein